MEQVTVSGGGGFVDVNTGKQPDLPAALRIALATGQLRRPLVDTLDALIAQLVDGDYRILGPLRLPDGRPLTASAGWPPADDARVTYYRTAIRDGHLPVAVVLADEDRELILDGHHKIAAYRAEDVAPCLIRISPGTAAATETETAC
ncbi:hypothetical protein [Amycolatopsis samaneae]|uniref:ParB/Sulfiredoxin domain-containing protein n=1 Tax=Amycolatopsis samaneae TaxID=664691 RepID=A0ABW5GDR3_9PSEU